MNRKRGEWILKVFAIFAIYLLQASLISVGAIAQDADPVTGEEETDYNNPETYNDPDFWSDTSSLDWNQVQWGQLSADAWDNVPADQIPDSSWDSVLGSIPNDKLQAMDQSNIPAESIANIPQEALNIEQITDPDQLAALTTEQLTHGNNLETVGDLGQLNPQAVSDALNQMHELGGTIITVVPGVVYQNGKLINEAACEQADIALRKCKLNLKLDDFKSTPDQQVVISAITEAIEGAEHPGFIICSGSSCQEITGEVNEITMENGVVTITTTDNQVITVNQGDVSTLVDADGNSILTVSEDGKVRFGELEIEAHGPEDDKTTITLSDNEITIDGPAQYTYRDLEGTSHKGYTRFNLDDNGELVGFTATNAHVTYGKGIFDGHFHFSIVDNNFDEVKLRSEGSYFDYDNKKKITHTGKPIEIKMLGEQLTGDGLDLASYMHIREGYAIKIAEFAEMDPEDLADLMLEDPYNIECSSTDDCLTKFDEALEQFEAKIEKMPSESSIVYLTDDGNDYSAYGQLQIESTETVDGEQVTNIIAHSHSQTMSYYSSKDAIPAFIIDNNYKGTDEITIADVQTQVIAEYDGKKETFEINSKYKKSGGTVKVGVSSKDALDMQRLINDHPDIDFTTSANIMPVSDDGRKSHVIIDDGFVHGFVALAEERDEFGNINKVTVNVGEEEGVEGIADRVNKYKEEREEILALFEGISIAVEGKEPTEDQQKQLQELQTARYEQLHELIGETAAERAETVNELAAMSGWDEDTADYQAYKALYTGILLSDSPEEARAQYQQFYDYATIVSASNAELGTSLLTVANRNIGKSYLEESNYEQALASYLDIDESLRSTNDWLAIAQTHQDMDNTNAAIQAYKDGYETSSGDNKNYFLDKIIQTAIEQSGLTIDTTTADTTQLSQEFNEILSSLELGISSDEYAEMRNKYIARRLGQHYEETGDVEVLKKAIEYDPTNTGNLRALTYVTEGDEKQYYMDSLENELNRVERESQFTLDVSGERSLLEGMKAKDYLVAAKDTSHYYDDAESSANMAIFLDYKNTNARDTLANVYLETERRDEALTEYKTIFGQLESDGRTAEMVYYGTVVAQMLGEDRNYREEKEYLEKTVDALAAELAQIDEYILQDAAGNKITGCVTCAEKLAEKKQALLDQIGQITAIAMNDLLIGGGRVGDASRFLSYVDDKTGVDLKGEYREVITAVNKQNLLQTYKTDERAKQELLELHGDETYGEDADGNPVTIEDVVFGEDSKALFDALAAGDTEAAERELERLKRIYGADHDFNIGSGDDKETVTLDNVMGRLEERREEAMDAFEEERKQQARDQLADLDDSIESSYHKSRADADDLVPSDTGGLSKKAWKQRAQLAIDQAEEQYQEQLTQYMHTAAQLSDSEISQNIARLTSQKVGASKEELRLLEDQIHQLELARNIVRRTGNPDDTRRFLMEQTIALDASQKGAIDRVRGWFGPTQRQEDMQNTLALFSNTDVDAMRSSTYAWAASMSEDDRQAAITAAQTDLSQAGSLDEKRAIKMEIRMLEAVDLMTDFNVVTNREIGDPSTDEFFVRMEENIEEIEKRRKGLIDLTRQAIFGESKRLRHIEDEMTASRYMLGQALVEADDETAKTIHFNYVDVEDFQITNTLMDDRNERVGSYNDILELRSTELLDAEEERIMQRYREENYYDLLAKGGVPAYEAAAEEYRTSSEFAGELDEYKENEDYLQQMQEFEESDEFDEQLATHRRDNAEIISQLAQVQTALELMDQTHSKRDAIYDKELKSPFVGFVEWYWGKKVLPTLGLMPDNAYDDQKQNIEDQSNFAYGTMRSESVLAGIDLSAIDDPALRDMYQRQMIDMSRDSAKMQADLKLEEATAYAERHSVDETGWAGVQETFKVLTLTGVQTAFRGITGTSNRRTDELLSARGELLEDYYATGAVLNYMDRRGLSLSEIDSIDNPSLQEFVDRVEERDLFNPDSFAGRELTKNDNAFQATFIDQLASGQSAAATALMSGAIMGATRAGMAGLAGAGEKLAGLGTRVASNAGKATTLSRGLTGASNLAKGTVKGIEYMGNHWLNPFKMTQKIEDITVSGTSRLAKATTRVLSNTRADRMLRAAKRVSSVSLSGGETIGSATKGIVKYYTFQSTLEEVALPWVVGKAGGDISSELLDPLESLSGARRGKRSLTTTYRIDPSTGAMQKYEAGKIDIRAAAQEHKGAGYDVTEITTDAGIVVAIEVREPGKIAVAKIIAVEGTQYDSDSITVSTEQRVLLTDEGTISLHETPANIQIGEITDSLQKQGMQDIESIEVTTEDGSVVPAITYTNDKGERTIVVESDPTPFLSTKKPPVESVASFKVGDKDVTVDKQTTVAGSIKESIESSIDSNDVNTRVVEAEVKRIIKERRILGRDVSDFFRSTQPYTDLFATESDIRRDISESIASAISSNKPTSEVLDLLKGYGVIDDNYQVVVDDHFIKEYVGTAIEPAVKQRSKELANLETQSELVEKVMKGELEAEVLKPFFSEGSLEDLDLTELKVELDSRIEDTESKLDAMTSTEELRDVRRETSDKQKATNKEHTDAIEEGGLEGYNTFLEQKQKDNMKEKIDELFEEGKKLAEEGDIQQGTAKMQQAVFAAMSAETHNEDEAMKMVAEFNKYQPEDTPDDTPEDPDDTPPPTTPPTPTTPDPELTPFDSETKTFDGRKAVKINPLEDESEEVTEARDAVNDYLDMSDGLERRPEGRVAAGVGIALATAGSLGAIASIIAGLPVLIPLAFIAVPLASSIPIGRYFLETPQEVYQNSVVELINTLANEGRDIDAISVARDTGVLSTEGMRKLYEPILNEAITETDEGIDVYLSDEQLAALGIEENHEQVEEILKQRLGVEEVKCNKGSVSCALPNVDKAQVQAAIIGIIEGTEITTEPEVTEPRPTTETTESKVDEPTVEPTTKVDIDLELSKEGLLGDSINYNEESYKVGGASKTQENGVVLTREDGTTLTVSFDSLINYVNEVSTELEILEETKPEDETQPTEETEPKTTTEAAEDSDVAQKAKKEQEQTTEEPEVKIETTEEFTGLTTKDTTKPNTFSRTFTDEQLKEIEEITGETAAITKAREDLNNYVEKNKDDLSKSPLRRRAPIIATAAAIIIPNLIVQTTIIVTSIVMASILALVTKYSIKNGISKTWGALKSTFSSPNKQVIKKSLTLINALIEEGMYEEAIAIAQQTGVLTEEGTAKLQQQAEEEVITGGTLKIGDTVTYEEIKMVVINKRIVDGVIEYDVIKTDTELGTVKESVSTEEIILAAIDEITITHPETPEQGVESAKKELQAYTDQINQRPSTDNVGNIYHALHMHGTNAFTLLQTFRTNLQLRPGKALEEAGIIPLTGESGTATEMNQDWVSMVAYNVNTMGTVRNYAELAANRFIITLDNVDSHISKMEEELGSSDPSTQGEYVKRFGEELERNLERLKAAKEQLLQMQKDGTYEDYLKLSQIPIIIVGEHSGHMTLPEGGVDAERLAERLNTRVVATTAENVETLKQLLADNGIDDVVVMSNEEIQQQAEDENEPGFKGKSLVTMIKEGSQPTEPEYKPSSEAVSATESLLSYFETDSLTSEEVTEIVSYATAKAEGAVLSDQVKGKIGGTALAYLEQANSDSTELRSQGKSDSEIENNFVGGINTFLEAMTEDAPEPEVEEQKEPEPTDTQEPTEEPEAQRRNCYGFQSNRRTKSSKRSRIPTKI